MDFSILTAEEGVLPLPFAYSSRLTVLRMLQNPLGLVADEI
jgi:hypothetical protein